MLAVRLAQQQWVAESLVLWTPAAHWCTVVAHQSLRMTLSGSVRCSADQLRHWHSVGSGSLPSTLAAGCWRPVRRRMAAHMPPAYCLSVLSDHVRPATVLDGLTDTDWQTYTRYALPSKIGLLNTGMAIYKSHYCHNRLLSVVTKSPNESTDVPDF